MQVFLFIPMAVGFNQALILPLSGVSELYQAHLIPISALSAEVLCYLCGSTGSKGILACPHAGCLYRGQAATGQGAGSLLGYQRV